MKLYEQCVCGAEFSGASLMRPRQLVALYRAFIERHKDHVPDAKEEDPPMMTDVIPGSSGMREDRYSTGDRERMGFGQHDK